LVGKAFTPRSVAALAPRVQRLAAEHVAAMADNGPPADLVADLAAPMAITVISELLGVAIEERDRFRALADAVSAADPFSFAGDEDALMAGAQAWERLSGYAAGLVAAKREELCDDLLSALIAVHDAQDGRLGDNELTAMASTLVAAGYSTACNAISVGTIELITEGRLAALATDPEQADAIVDEVLRRQAGLIGEPFPRWAHENVELAGASITAGDLVLVRLQAANRDPEQFADPDRFLPGRSGPHLAFGRGPHHCLGAALARLEVGAALGALARQLPGLQLQGSVDDIVWARGIDAGPTALHVTW
jgi:cytochrome P450